MTWTNRQQEQVTDLINRLQQAPQRSTHVPGRGDPDLVDEYLLVVTAEERNLVMRALDFIDEFNRGHS